MDLEYISKHDKEWRAYIYSICKDKDITHEVVQEMYIKVSTIEKEIDKFYILAILRNSYFNLSKKLQKKTLKEKPITYELEVNYTGSNFEPTDEQQDILNNFKNQKWYRQILLEESYDTSIRKIADKYNINYGFVFREIDKARKEILQQ